MKDKPSFREKLADAKDFPRVQELTGGMKRRYGPGTIVLPAPGGEAARAGFPSVEIGLDSRLVDGDPGGAAVEDDTHAAAVGFAPGGDPK